MEQVLEGWIACCAEYWRGAKQRLRFYVDGALILETLTIDDDWDSGYVGLFCGSVTNTANFDDLKFGFYSDADGDAADTSDDVLIIDDFASAAITLVSDANCNLTDDGVFKYKYDSLIRRIRKDVTNTGIAIVPGSDAGGATRLKPCRGRQTEPRASARGFFNSPFESEPGAQATA